MIVSAKAYPDPLFGITRSAEDFSYSLANNAHSETTQNMVWTRVNFFDEPTNQLITRIGGDSLCPITLGEDHENPDGPYLFSDVFQDLLYFFAPGLGSDIEAYVRYKNLNSPYFLCLYFNAINITIL